MTVCGVDHEYVDPGREQRFGLESDVTTDSDRRPNAQPARRVASAGSYSVLRSAPSRVRSPRSRPAESTTGASRCRPSCSRANASCPDRVRKRQQLDGHDLSQLGVPIDAEAVRVR